MSGKCGCGCGGSSHSHSSHNACPPMMECDTAKTHADFCTVGTLNSLNQIEQTVILAQVPLHITTEADICLPSPAQEIKHIRKNVFLTQCKAVPRFDPNGGGLTARLDLFIEGFVHKNIQFSESCNGFVRDFSVNVPFRCFTPVNVNHFPFCSSQKSNEITETREMDKDGMGSNRCAFGSRTFENFNEPIKCKLINAEVNQFDIPKNFDRWGNFKEITEKVSIDLLVRLTQVQHRATGVLGSFVDDCIDNNL
ncbi:hypothetical protein V7128_11325 [Neobacillus vireti]|uniref:CsxC family protein n=1 Tax=Neobacillus vireti TaxID=220686 RepID=UPI002FFFFF39